MIRSTTFAGPETLRALLSTFDVTSGVSTLQYKFFETAMPLPKSRLVEGCVICPLSWSRSGIKKSFVIYRNLRQPTRLVISGRFIKQSILYTVSGALPMASAVVLLPFYIHHLSTDLYGALSLYMALSLFVQILVNFSFDTSIYIHYHEYKSDPPKLSVFVSSVFVSLLIIALGVGFAFALTGDALARIFFSDREVSFFPFGLAAVGSGAAQAIFKVYCSLLQTSEKPAGFFWSNLVSFGLVAAFTIVGLELFPSSLVGPILGRFFAVLLSASWALYRIFAYYGFKPNFGWLKESLSFNIYSFIYQILLWVNNYFDRFLMLMFLVVHDVGVYDFAFKCLIPLELLMSGIHNSFYPRVVSTVMAQSEKGSDATVTRYYHGLVAAMMLFVAAAIVALPWVIETFVRRDDYQESIQYIPLLAVTYLFRTIRLFFVAPYGMLKFTKPLPGIYLFVSTVKILLIVVLIDSFGVLAVIMSSLAVAVLEPVVLSLRIRSMFKFRFNALKLLVAPSLLAIVIVAVEFFAVSGALTHWHHLGYLAFASALIAWFYRRELVLLKKSIPLF